MDIIHLEGHDYNKILERSHIDSGSVIQSVNEIISRVKEDGDQALQYYSQKFDGAILDDLLVSEDEINNSLQNISSQVKGALEQAAHNIEIFHQAQIPSEWTIEVEEGVHAGQIIRPLGRVGCYIPGGRAVYPSTILMTVIPAKVAGVQEIVCCTPPHSDGKVNDVVLAAAHLAGAHKIYKVGGAQAIAALAYGTETIEKVDKIVGPGNVFVTAAKQLVYGEVDIDFPAGPSEVLILADETANPEYIALDLLAQAEHDPDAASVLVTNSSTLARQVEENINEELPHMERRNIIEESLDKNGRIIIVENLDEGLEFTNKYAPEHLIIMTQTPKQQLKDITNAGSIFLGELTPVAAGDYGSGTNHVLPTSFCARMYSGLSTESFLKKPTVQELSPAGLKKLENMVITLAQYEGLYAHAESYKRRVKDKKNYPPRL